MKKLLVAGIAAAALCGAPALAADLPVKAPVYRAAAEPLFSWSGFYVGLNAGGERSTADIVLVPGSSFTAANIAFLSANGSLELRDTSFTGGAQAGANVQSGIAVFGLEGDFNYFGFKASRSGLFTSGPPASLAPYIQSEVVKADWLATMRARLGVTSGMTLFYVTGGLAVADVKFAQGLSFLGGVFPVNTGSVSQTKAGWTVGGGVEWAAKNNWSVKAEYLYADLGKVSFSSDDTLVPGAGFSLVHSAHLTANIVRLGVNYKFGDMGKAPVVAKY